SLLLAAACAGAVRPRGRCPDRRAVDCGEERAVISARHQLQRPASLAEAWCRTRLGHVRQDRRERAEWRSGGCTAPPACTDRGIAIARGLRGLGCAADWRDPGVITRY